MEKQVRINGTDVRYQVSFRDVRYPRLEFKTGNLLLVLPRNQKNEEEVISKHLDWIKRKSSIIEDSLEDLKEKSLELERTDEDFKNIVRSLVTALSVELGIEINRIFFRKMRSKWGSCSPGKNLTINTLLRYLPSDLIEYVILHEMVHVIEKKHNGKFWKIVNKRFGDCQKYESDLLSYWFLIQNKSSSSCQSSSFNRSYTLKTIGQTE